MPHIHRSHRSGRLRAGVLGANDGVLSISSLVMGVAAAHGDPHAVVVAAAAGIVAGVFAMGAGEYVSVSSQADTERADLDLERQSLRHAYHEEEAELADIYVKRGISPELARSVAQQLMAHDALDAHARDEIGISATLAARPLQAAIVSAVSFALGGLVPLLVAVLCPRGSLMATMAGASLVFLMVLGALAAYAGGAPVIRGAVRVFVWGSLTMLATSLVGSLFGSGPA